MHRLLIAIATVALGTGLVACGEDGSTPSVESAGEALDALGDAAEEAAGDVGRKADELAAQARETAEAMQDALSAEGQSCLDLVKAGSFAEAVPVCLSAAQADPDNGEIQAALEKAQGQTQVATEGAQGALEGLADPLGN